MAGDQRSATPCRSAKHFQRQRRTRRQVGVTFHGHEVAGRENSHEMGVQCPRGDGRSNGRHLSVGTKAAQQGDGHRSQCRHTLCRGAKPARDRLAILQICDLR